jgi:hypothetical protein
MIDRDFKVSAKGLKGKSHDKPFVVLANKDGERFEIHLETKQMLDQFQIDEEFTVRIGEGAQTKLGKK